LLPPTKLIFAATKGRDRIAKSLPMGRLVIAALSHLVINDVEAVEVIGDFAFRVIEIAPRRSAPAMFFLLATAGILVPSSATKRPLIKQLSRQNWMKAALAPTMASGVLSSVDGPCSARVKLD
jgi:hypothetical protein